MDMRSWTKGKGKTKRRQESKRKKRVRRWTSQEEPDDSYIH